MKRGAAALFALIPALLLVGSLTLADRQRVVIVARSADDPAVVRVRGELTMLGAEVEVVVQQKPTADLEALAKRFSAAAALRVETAPAAIVLWVEPGAGATPGEARVSGLAEERDPALLALRAVEVLRARLIIVPVAAPPAEDDAAAPVPDAPAPDASAPDAPAPDASVPLVPDASAPAAADAGDASIDMPPPKPERTHPVGISAGAAMLVSPGGVPAAAHARFGVEWDPIPRLGVEAMAFVPLTAPTVTAPEGSMELKAFGFGGGLSAKVTDPRADFSLSLGLGAQAMRLSFIGQAEAPWADGSGSHWAVAPFASASAAYRFHPRFVLRLDLLAEVVRPEPVLRIAGHDAATFGQPAVLPAISAEVRP